MIQSGMCYIPLTQCGPASCPDRTASSAHWIDDPKVRARFWAWTGKLTLTKEQVHKALGVKSVHDYAGTMDDARAAIEKWIKAQAAAVMAGEQ